MRTRDGRGQATAELALLLPLLVVLMSAIVQVALVGRSQILVVHAARAAGRTAAVDPRPAVVRQAAVDATDLDPERLAVTVEEVDGMVTVTVRYNAPTDVVGVGSVLGDVTLEGRARFRLEG